MNLSHILLLLKVKIIVLVNGLTRGNARKRMGKLLALAGGGFLFFFIYNWILDIFSTLAQKTNIGVTLIDNMIIVILLGFFIFLLTSGITVSLHHLFISSDLPLLMVSPLSSDTIFTFKLIEAVFANSTFFFFMGLPIFIAYGRITQAEWYYYPFMLINVFIFLSIPVSISFLGALLIVRIIPAHKARDFTVILLGIISLTIWLILQVVRATIFDQNSQDFNPRAIASLQQVSDHWLFNSLPSTWAALALAGFAQSNIRLIIFNFLPLVLVMAFIYTVGIQLTKHALKQGLMSSVQSITLKRQKMSKEKLVGPLIISSLFSGASGSIFFRDFKLLIRDTRQIVNILLLALMMVLLPLLQHPERFDSDFSLYYPYIFLIIFSTFVSGQISSRLIPLEGKAFWIMKLIPQSSLKLISGKFLLAFSLSTILSWIAVAIIYIYFHHPCRVFILALVATFCLSGILSSLGLLVAAYFSRFDWDHPKRMLSSTGGLLLSLSSLLIVVIIGGLVVLLYYAGSHLQFSIAVLDLLSIGIILILTVIFVIIANFLSAKKVDKMEWVF